MNKHLLMIIGILFTSVTLLFADTYSRANDIVTDHDINLQWQDTPYSDADKNTYNSETTESNRARQWIHAGAYCKNLSLDGGGWRLPEINELNTIVDKSHHPAIISIFENMLGKGTWSNTKYNENTAYGIDFSDGSQHYCYINKKSKLIRCVRKTTETDPSENKPPVSKAGLDQIVTEGEPVTLDGSASSDSDGTISSYMWKEGSTVLSYKESFSKSDFTVGKHTITLTVKDNDGAADSDTVVITVNAAANNAPVAKAGADQTVTEGEPVTLDGSGSSDSDGTISSYSWKEGNTLLSDKASFSKSDFIVGKHTITLTVKDNDGASDSDTVVVTVNTPANNTPLAKAGTDKNIIEGETVTLDGSGSSDPDGTINTYVWKEGSTVLSREISFDKIFSVGTHTITLTVTDNEDATVSDEIIITVQAISGSVPDWCNIENNGETVKYTATESKSAVEFPTAEFEVKEQNDEMIVFEEKSSLNVGNCQVKVYVKMENDGKIDAGYRHEGSNCSNNIDTFAPGTTVNIGSDMVLLIDAPLTDDLVLGGK